MPPLHSLLRRLLEIDRPHPSFEGEALDHEVHRNYRWNLAVSVGEVGLFFFGMAFIASTTILPLFISKLTSSTLAVGLVALLAQGGWYLPQLFTAHATERVPRMLPIMVNVGLFAERLPRLRHGRRRAPRRGADPHRGALPGFRWEAIARPGSSSGALFSGRPPRLHGFGLDRDRFGVLGAASGPSGGAPYPASFVAIFALGALSVCPAGS
jgi:hypothetical protein